MTQREELNIVDFGVAQGNAASQTAAILAAFNAHPRETFYFPPGDYRLDTTLHITSGVGIHLAGGARIFAGAAMDQLIRYDNSVWSISGWDPDKGIYGHGLLDGMLLAKDVLHVSSVLRFTIGDGLSIKDPVERGLVTGPRGCEYMVTNLRVYNTTNTNTVNSIGIESNVADSSYRDVVVRDFTIGAKENAPNFWTDFHPWIGSNIAQIGARYENSVGFWVHGARPTLTNGYIDTYRYGVRVTRPEDETDNGRAIVYNLRHVVASSPPIAELLQDYPGSVFDIAPTCIVDSNFGYYNTRPDVPRAFITGDASRVTIRGGSITPGAITGFAQYERGTLIGNRAWTPTIIGSVVPGEHAYETQTGVMNVDRDGMATWSFVVRATLDSTISGVMRIAGAPFPQGSSGIAISPMGVVTYTSANLNNPTGLQAGTWGSGSTGSINVLRGNNNIQTAGLQGQMVEIFGTFSAPCNAPMI